MLECLYNLNTGDNMVKLPKILLSALVLISMASAKDYKKEKVEHVASTKGSNCNSYQSFRKHVNLRKSYKVFKDKGLLCKANGKNTHLKTHTILNHNLHGKVN